ncbi:MAG: ABC transporter permease subunit [Spirochaetales bacterium]|nr:ABC transporter permease subunit [Spirochaetales bacterium]
MRAKNERLAALAGAATMLAGWKLASLCIGKDIILPPPERVLIRAAALFAEPAFIHALAATLGRGLAAFALSMAAGALIGAGCGASPRFAAFVSPLLSAIRALPVIALILLFLFWFDVGAVPVFAAFLMAFPVVAAQVAEGWRSTDPRLLEMASLFRLERGRVLFGIRVPSMTGHLAAAAQAAIGLSWKVVIAGEVLSQPARALGTGLQDRRLMLDTAGVLAWAAAGVLLCALSDAVFRAFRLNLARHGL